MARIHTISDPEELAKNAKWKAWPDKLGTAIAFPVFVPGRREAIFSRLRPDKPHGPQKYLNPKGTPVHPYFGPRTLFEGRLNDPSIPIVLTEGEKKTLILDQMGFAAVGATGVDCFHDTEWKKASGEWILHPLIRQNTTFEGSRRVIIAYDSDSETKPQVMDAAKKLAWLLKQCGASEVLFVRIPAEGDEKYGIDDYFFKFGEEATREIIAEAVPIAPLKPKAKRGSRARAGDSEKSADPARAKGVFERGDETELAQHIVKTLRRAGTRVVFDEGKFWKYDTKKNDGRWVELARHDLARLTIGLAGSPVAHGEDGIRPLKVGSSTVRGVIELLEAILARPGFFEGAAPGLAFRNSFVQVTSRGIEQVPHSESHRARFAYDFDYEPSAPAPLFMRTQGEIFECEPPPSRVSDAFEASDAQTKIMLMQEKIGLSLLGLGTRFQAAVVFLGDGANGKSLLLQLFLALFPPGSTCSIPPQEMAQEYRRALLAGKRLNGVEELPKTSIIDSEAPKAVVAGGEITGREIRKSPFSFRPIAGNIWAANNLPAVSDQSHGLWRRLKVITFERIFAAHEQDPTLADRILTEEAPGIVAWALEGAQRALEQGHLTEPASSRAALAKWRTGSDPVREFIEEKVVQVPPDAGTWNRTPFNHVYEAYRTWCTESGYRPLAKNRFSERMRVAGIDSVKGSKGARFYWVRLLEEGFGEDDEGEVELEPIGSRHQTAGKEWLL